MLTAAIDPVLLARENKRPGSLRDCECTMLLPVLCADDADEWLTAGIDPVLLARENEKRPASLGDCGPSNFTSAALLFAISTKPTSVKVQKYCKTVESSQNKQKVKTSNHMYDQMYFIVRLFYQITF